MNKKDQLLKKLDRASELAAKGTELTDEEVTEANALADEIASLKAEVAAADATAKRLSGLARVDVHETTGMPWEMGRALAAVPTAADVAKALSEIDQEVRFEDEQ